MSAVSAHASEALPKQRLTADAVSVYSALDVCLAAGRWGEAFGLRGALGALGIYAPTPAVTAYNHHEQPDAVELIGRIDLVRPFFHRDRSQAPAAQCGGMCSSELFLATGLWHPTTTDSERKPKNNQQGQQWHNSTPETGHD
ncbi:unnamed protein product [Symbiodinium natans]|uniref:Uncharacterized protein n=1 Tax=Symbiodinium natans TaxID=878477 RepID=A0A812T0U6_9DINO|nr:unnamed protein product [Symbiodinium natans]